MSTERGEVRFRAGDWILRDAEGNETIWSPAELDDVDEEGPDDDELEPDDDELFADDEDDDRPDDGDGEDHDESDRPPR